MNRAFDRLSAWLSAQIGRPAAIAAEAKLLAMNKEAAP